MLPLLVAFLWEHRGKIGGAWAACVLASLTWHFLAVADREQAKVAAHIQNLGAAGKHLQADPAGGCDAYIAALQAYDQQVDRSQAAVTEAGVKLIQRVETEGFKAQLKEEP